VKLETPAALLEAVAAPQAVPVADTSAELQAVADQLRSAEAAIIERDSALAEAYQKINELNTTVQEVKLQAARLVDEIHAQPVTVEPVAVVEPEVTATLEPAPIETKAPKKVVK
jgi:chromosome segregation ATPase